MSPKNNLQVANNLSQYNYNGLNLQIFNLLQKLDLVITPRLHINPKNKLRGVVYNTTKIVLEPIIYQPRTRNSSSEPINHTERHT